MARTKRKIAYLGPPGSFTHEATMKRFPEARYDLVEKQTLHDVFASAYHGESDYAVLPVENSTEGIIGVTYHELVDQGVEPKVKIQGEIYHAIVHNLAATGSTGIDKVRFVHTKDQAWGQCRTWVSRNLPHDVEFVEEPSTSKAAQMVMQLAQAERVAICSSLAIKIHNLMCIAHNIEDQHSNTTRFFIIGKHPLNHREKDRPYKVTLAMVLLDRVGALAEAFAVFKEANVDVRSVKVSPVRAEQIMKWKDWFFVDTAANSANLWHVDEAVQDMRNKEGLVLTIRELGRYPSGELAPQPKRTTEQSRIPKNLTLESVIAASEGTSVEFKSTLRWNIREQKKDSEIEFVVIKTIAGFMNGQGGVLLIGVDDVGTILGLDDDYKTLKKPGKDGFELHFRNLIHTEVGGELGHLVDVRFQSSDGKDACMIAVQPSPKPVWVNRGGKPEFYLRTGNQTKPLDSKETAEYVRMRWG